MGSLDTAPERPRIARNTIFSAIGEGSNLLLFLLGFLAARYLAPEAFGAFSAAFAFVGIFRILPDFGMAYASTLEISRNRSLAGRLIGNLLGFQGVLSLVTVALCLGTGRMLFPAPEDRTTWIAVVLLSFDLILKSAKSTLRWLLKGFQRFGTEAISLLLERVALLALGLASLRSGGGAIGFVLVFVIVRSFDTSGLWAYTNARILRLRPARDPALWAELLRKGLPFAYVGLVITLLFQVDIVLLERIRGAVEAGFYSAPVRILEGLTLVPRILGYALLPTMAALNARSPAAVGDLYRRGLKYLLLAGLPVAAFGLLASAPFIRLVFGPDYGPSIPLSGVLLPTALFMFLSNFSETTLACVNRWGTIVVTSTLALLLNVALNIVWIPLYGGMGAALARLLAEGAYALLTVTALHVYGYRTQWASVALRPLLATGAFAIVLWLSATLGLLASAALATAVFLLATLLLGVWDATERATLRRLFRREPDTPTENGRPKQG
jgi:O-antigen/teichoic acid export membrane protein